MSWLVHTLVVAVLAAGLHAADLPKSKVVKCAVCRSLVTELHDAISQVDPRKKVEVGSYRIGADGKQKLNSIKYAGSEMHMMEVMESVCQSMKDYVQARDKVTGKLEAIKLVSNGMMNPRLGEYDMIQDPDLNKGLPFYCESIVEMHDDDIVAHFRKNAEMAVGDSQDVFCNDLTQICKGVKDEL